MSYRCVLFFLWCQLHCSVIALPRFYVVLPKHHRLWLWHTQSCCYMVLGLGLSSFDADVKSWTASIPVPELAAPVAPFKKVSISGDRYYMEVPLSGSPYALRLRIRLMCVILYFLLTAEALLSIVLSSSLITMELMSLYAWQSQCL